jgi:predicted flap endonuclease-1-like 5' DNA nuclease
VGAITDIEGIGDVYGAKLKEAGIATTEALLEAGKDPRGRAGLAEKTGISDKHILTWVNHSDLFRITGIAGQHSELLEASGVDTVVELATRNPSHLASRLHEVNEDKHLVRSVPSETEVAQWIEQAKTLPRIVTY